MLKKLCFAGLLTGAGLIAFGATGLSSYTNTAFQKVKGTFKNQVPVEFQIDRVRQEVAQLVPDMKKNLGVIAEEMVAVQNLREDIRDTRLSLKQQKDRIVAMTNDLESGHELIVYDGREYSSTRIKERLARDFASYQLCEKELKSKEQILEAKERSLDMARKQLGSMREQKRDLEVQIAQLEAELKTVRLQQTKSKFELDDSRLAQIKGSLAEIRNRLKVEQTEADLHGEFGNDDMPVEKAKPAGQITKEVRKYFGVDVKALAEKK